MERPNQTADRFDEIRGFKGRKTVDGSEIRRENQLRLVVYPIIWQGFFFQYPRWLFGISEPTVWPENLGWILGCVFFFVIFYGLYHGIYHHIFGAFPKHQICKSKFVWVAVVDDMNAWEVNCCGVYAEKKLGWWFQTCLMFTPIWGRFPFWRAYFSDGLVQPPTQLLIENSQRETNRTLDVKMNIAPLKQVLYERGLADKKQREQKARSARGGSRSSGQKWEVMISYDI